MEATRAHSSGRPRRVLIIDDHAAFRDALTTFFSLQSPPIEVVGCVAEAAGGFEMIESTRPDVVVVDLLLPGIGGVATTREIVARWPNVGVLVLTADDRIEGAQAALSAGARGFALKHRGGEEIACAVETVARGRRFVTPDLAGVLQPAT